MQLVGSSFELLLIVCFVLCLISPGGSHGSPVVGAV